MQQIEIARVFKNQMRSISENMKSADFNLEKKDYNIALEFNALALNSISLMKNVKWVLTNKILRDLEIIASAQMLDIKYQQQGINKTKNELKKEVKELCKH
jgi:hypothetical protein